MARPRDSQRSKAYAWERALTKATPALARRLTRPECQQLVTEGWCRAAGSPDYARNAPRVVGRPGANRGCYSRKPNLIKLPEWTQYVSYVLHELAHALSPSTVPWHGEMWLAIYINLLAHYGELDAAELRRSARAIGLKVARNEGEPEPERKRPVAQKPTTVAWVPIKLTPEERKRIQEFVNAGVGKLTPIEALSQLLGRAVEEALSG